MEQKRSFGRKFWLGFILGLAFLAVSLVLGYTAMTVAPQVPLVGLSTVIGAIAVGLGSIMATFVWGNAKEYEAKNEQSPK
jgi:hypothetical protein